MSVPADDLFKRAREADIEAVSGLKLYRAGRRWRGECPLCGASKGKKADGAFSVDKGAGLFKCFACDAGGDVIELACRLRRCSPREAAEWLVGPDAIAVRRPVAELPPAAKTGEGLTDRIAGDLWTQARGAFNTPVERYLRFRGLDGPVLLGALAELLFHPSAYWGSEDGRQVRAPAMIARVRNEGGYTGGIHVTYLAPDGLGKARLAPAKKMWGRQTDAEGRPGGAWLCRPEDRGPIVVAEGIESALSAAMLVARDRGSPMVRPLAALSLGRLQGGWLVDGYGRLDPACVEADPARPAFTWPLAGLACEAVIIAVDRDMQSLRVKVRRPTGGTAEHPLSADERARICAGLAEQAWRRANPFMPANAVRAIAPGLGRDFNDELRASQ